MEAPFTPPPLPPVEDVDNKMVYLWLTEYIANTASWVYQEAGILKYNITPDMVRVCNVLHNPINGIIDWHMVS